MSPEEFNLQQQILDVMEVAELTFTCPQLDDKEVKS